MIDTDLGPYREALTGALHQFGLLPFTDRDAPSLVSIVAGVPISGSWWGHPSGGLIYRVGELLDDDPEVLTVKLWRGKRTLVDRRLWPALVRIATAREAWQISGLSEVARGLMDKVDREGSIQSDSLPPDFLPGSERFGPVLRRLEQRLLVLTRSVHTPSGSHALEAESWTAWRARTRTPRYLGTVASAKAAIAAAAALLSPNVDVRRALPWGRNAAARP